MLDREAMERMVGRTTYIGDGVYAELDPACMIVLKTNRGEFMHAPNVHWLGLEPNVFSELLRFAINIGWTDLIRRSLKNADLP